jgi:uncharacterized membrane protein
MATFCSNLSNQEFPLSDKVSGKTIRKSLLQFIQVSNPAFSEDQYLSISELNYYREKFIADSLIKEMGELTELEKTVLTSLTEESILADKLDEAEDKASKLTRGQRVADKVASFGGSWKFISSFGIFIVAWIFANIVFLSNKGFDPYPFILLNLILSCLASIQAPVIMMSQNRQEEKDRERAKRDYMINLKAELEIRILHEKIDHLIMHQQQELLEMQKVQIEMMNDILQKVAK